MKKYYNTRDSYMIYKTLSEDPVDIKKYIKIANAFMLFISRKLLEVGSITLPEKLGKINVIGRKVKVRIEDGEIKGLAPDWVKTKELWNEDPEAKAKKQLVYHFNEDTNGIRYKFTWSKSRVLVSNKTLYGFKLTRTNKRALSKLVKTGKEYLIKN